MEKETLEYLILIILLSSLIIIYFAYISYDYNKKINYYKSIISYETDWDKYSEMVKHQKRVIRKKKINLYYLKTLVFMKGLIKWN